MASVTLEELWQETRLVLGRLENPDAETRWLIEAVLGISPMVRYTASETLIAPEKYQKFCSLRARRQQGEPLSRLTGTREFWSMPFHIIPATLDPRQDSETIIEAVLDAFPDRQVPLRVLDFGTGSGCLLLSVLSEYPAAYGVGIDISAQACACAYDNARGLGLAERAAFVTASWATAVAAKANIIISNPPYIPSAVVDTLEPVVRHYDPRAALDGGEDGLEPYRLLLAAFPALLQNGGRVFLEIGMGQEQDIMDIAATCGLQTEALRKDISGIVRCLVMKTAILG
jgi:release factor glutamine methyltransferase